MSRSDIPSQGKCSSVSAVSLEIGCSARGRSQVEPIRRSADITRCSGSSRCWRFWQQQSWCMNSTLQVFLWDRRVCSDVHLGKNHPRVSLFDSDMSQSFIPRDCRNRSCVMHETSAIPQLSSRLNLDMSRLCSIVSFPKALESSEAFGYSGARF